jgi:hypothetical protein
MSFPTYTKLLKNAGRSQYKEKALQQLDNC